MKTGTAARKAQAGKPSAARRDVEAFRANLERQATSAKATASQIPALVIGTPRAALLRLADETMAAFHREQAAAKESHRCHALAFGDPQHRSVVQYCEEQRAEFRRRGIETTAIDQLARKWAKTIYARHGYDRASDEWSDATEAFRKKARAFFFFNGKTPDELLLKIGMLHAFEQDAEHNRSDLAEETLGEVRDMLVSGMARDLKRMAKRRE